MNKTTEVLADDQELYFKQKQAWGHRSFVIFNITGRNWNKANGEQAF